MKKYAYAFFALLILVLSFGVYAINKLPKTNNQVFSPEAADESSLSFTELYKARVTDVLTDNQEKNSHLAIISETLQVVLLTGPDKGKQVEVGYSEQLNNAKQQEVLYGDVIVVGELESADGTSYVMVDRYRLPYLGYIAVIFLILAIVFGRIRGLTSVIGLLVSIAILIWFITPNILAGKSPVLVTLVGAGIIAIVSMFLAHGLKQRTMLAVISTLLTLGIAQIMAYFFVIGAKLLGNGSEEALNLQAGYLGNVNLQGLLLGGIIIGTLGVLNDITTAQSATVEELRAANDKLSFKQLYEKGLSVGREHIASLINTLVLTYVGTSLPLFLLFTINSKQLWTVLNSSTIAEEIVRTLVGSIALILAVPIATALAAYYFTQESK